jgi:ribosomal protein S18 acetylase RimI-like enzyme
MNEDFIIRDFCDNDYPEIVKLWDETGMGGVQRGDNLDAIHKTLSCGGKLLVLEINKQIAGTSWISNDGRRLYLHHFGILPIFQSKGYSKPLLNASLEIAAKAKMQIKLEVHKNNTIAVNLYKNAGFKFLGDYDVYIIRDI